MAKSELAELLEIVNFIKDHMVTNMMTKDEGMTKADGEAIRRDVADLSHRVTRLEEGQDKILEVLEPLSKAHDRDSEVIIDHGKRITRLEQRLPA